MVEYSINIPCIDAFENEEPFSFNTNMLILIVDERHGVKYGHGNQ